MILLHRSENSGSRLLKIASTIINLEIHTIIIQDNLKVMEALFPILKLNEIKYSFYSKYVKPLV